MFFRRLHGMPAYLLTLAILLPASYGMTAFGPSSPRVSPGTRPQDLAFHDTQGKRWSLLDARSAPAIYLFVSTRCPIANAYTPRIRALAADAIRKGYRVFGVYPNAADSTEAVVRHARERRYTFPIVKDDGTLAQRLGATMTPQAVVLDRDGALRYRGRIDDDQDPARVRHHDLADALAALQSGSRVRRETAAFGCVIQSKPLTPDRHARVTYARDVTPILQRNCLSCHRTGEVAPFSMEDYRQVAAWARQIKSATASRRMPPWKADSRGEFLDERRLTDAEIALIGDWVDAGAPSGDLKNLPPTPTVAPRGWRLGQPELVAGIRQPFSVGSEGRDLYRCFVVPTDFAEDRYISALEVHPGNRAIVHHVIAWLDTSGSAEMLDAADPGEGYTTTGGFPGFIPAGFLGGWAPGNEPRRLPDDVGILLPRGARIVMEVHYHRNGKTETDQTTFGMHFCSGPVRKRLRVSMIANPQFTLPPGDSDCVVRAALPFAKDITVLSVMPHMHLLGRAMRVSAMLPDRREKDLVRIRDWDFNWQVTYAFRTPVRLPAGSTVHTVAHYDNSSDNPRNPNRPPKAVTWGEQTTDEMNLAFLFYTVDDEDLSRSRQISGR